MLVGSLDTGSWPIKVIKPGTDQQPNIFVDSTISTWRQGLGLIHKQLVPDLGRRHNSGRGFSTIPLSFDGIRRNLILNDNVGKFSQNSSRRDSLPFDLYSEIFLVLLDPFDELQSPCVVLRVLLQGHIPNLRHLENCILLEFQGR